MTKMIDLTGQRFGRLTVRCRARLDAPRVYWLCDCDCGFQCELATTHLRSGHSTSCGCVRKEVTGERNKANAKHGMWRTREFAAWSKMIARCENPNTQRYAEYGGRGISVCAEWRHSFEAFFAHIGPRPDATHSLDRIDNDQGYEPGNVRWAVPEVQNNNRRVNVVVVIQGVSKTVAQWAVESGLSHRTISYRVKAGWPEDRILAESRR